MPNLFSRPSTAAFCTLLTLAACVADEPVAPRHSDLDKGALVRLADRLQGQGDNAMAAAFYEKAIALDEKNVAAYYGLAKLQQAMGDAPGAERTFREALRYDSDNAAILRDYAKLRLTQGDAGDAVRHYRAALATDKKDARALNGLGVALDQLGQHTEAQEQYRAALAQNADDMTATNNLGLSLMMSGDALGAAAVLAPAAESFKGTDAIRQNLALALSKTRETQKFSAARPLTTEQPAAPAPLATVTQRPAALDTVKLAPQPPAVALPQAVPPASLSALPPPPAPTDGASPLSAAGISLSEPPPPFGMPATATKSWAKALPTPSAAISPTSKPPAQPVATRATTAIIAPAVAPVIAATPAASAPSLSPVMLAVAEPVATSVVTAAAVPSRQLWKLRRGHDAMTAKSAQAAVFGPFATDAVALRQQSLLQRQLHDMLPPQHVMNVVTTMTPEGTPQFRIQVYGFSGSNGVAEFCAAAGTQSLPCSNP